MAAGDVTAGEKQNLPVSPPSRGPPPRKRGPDRLCAAGTAYWLFCVPLGDVLEPDPEVPPDEAPPEVLPLVEPPEVLPLGCADWSLEDELELELGALGVAELPEDELGVDALPDPELEELGLDGVALDDEDELGELGVVALPDIEPELEPERLVASPDEPELELDVAPGPPAPRFASPPRSQP